MLGVRQEPTTRADDIAVIPDGHRRSGEIIAGACSGSEFATAEIRICADSLSAEEAIGTWLEMHGIRVARRLWFPRTRGGA